MIKSLILIAGIAVGCLLMLTLKLPWLEPFNTNVATVVAALSSTVLAVLGAFALWAHQGRAKQRDLDQLVIPLFEPLYTSLCQLRDLSNRDTAIELYVAIQKAFPGSPVKEPSPREITDYQDDAFPRAIKIAMQEARTVLMHWDSLQGVLLGISTKSVSTLLALHQVASAMLQRLPDLESDSHPTDLSQIGPQVKPADSAMLAWAVGRVAHGLNSIDNGQRDESGFTALEPARLAAIKRWAATSGHM